MNKKIIILSLFAAVIVTMLPLSSVVGIQTVQSNAKKGTLDSPLFSQRLGTTLKKDNNLISSRYLGKENSLNLFLSRQSSIEKIINKAVKIIQTNPNILDKLIEKLESSSLFKQTIDSQNLDMNDIKNEINKIKVDPWHFKEIVEKYNIKIPGGDTPQPLGLSTSNPLACFIIVIAVAPVFMILAIMLATMTIITCLNINNCFETLWNGLVEGFIQGLVQPDN